MQKIFVIFLNADSCFLGVCWLAPEVPGYPEQEGGSADGRNQHRSEAAGKRRHHRQHPGQVGHPVSSLETAKERPERQPLHRGWDAPHRRRKRSKSKEESRFALTVFVLCYVKLIDAPISLCWRSSARGWGTSPLKSSAPSASWLSARRCPTPRTWLTGWVAAPPLRSTSTPTSGLCLWSCTSRSAHTWLLRARNGRITCQDS